MAGEAGRTFASTTLIDAMADLVHQGVFVYTKGKIWIAGEAPAALCYSNSSEFAPLLSVVHISRLRSHAAQVAQHVQLSSLPAPALGNMFHWKFLVF